MPGHLHIKLNRHPIRTMICIILMQIAVLMQVGEQAFADLLQRDVGEFYVREYGRVNYDKNQKTAEAYSIFQRLSRISRIDETRTSRLIILPESAADWVNWAVSLPDGSIVIVENLLDLCFGESRQLSDKGKARLAFIIGHELSHLLNGDHAAYSRMASLSFDSGNKGSLEIRKLESKADYSGLILMTMAEYEPGYLIDGSNFFREYITKTGATYLHRRHFTPDDRVRQLGNNLKPLMGKISLFANGVRLYRQQKYLQAAESFRQFSEFFPGREVDNNIGLSYFQAAFVELAGEDPAKTLRFMPATMLEAETLALKLKPHGLGKARSRRDRIEKYLKLARHYLSCSLDKDPDYLPAEINFSSLELILENLDTALEHVNHILEKYPRHSGALNNKAIALFKQDPERNGEASLKILDSIKSELSSSSARYVRYNRVRITTDQYGCNKRNIRNTGEGIEKCSLFARKSWQPFLTVDNASPYATYVKLELKEASPAEKPTTEKGRTALIIGNGSYSDSPLLNPISDAHSMKHVLEKLGFVVILGVDLERQEILSRIEAFAQKLSADKTALFYYSGHGVQVGGENFILPIDFDGADVMAIKEASDRPAAFRQRAVSLQILTDKLEKAGSLHNFIILDACRNNPFDRLEGFSHEFAEMEAPPGTFIAYSTTPGETAWDGVEGGSGVFTQALLKHIDEPNLDVHELFRIVRKEVAEETGNYQTTWDVSTLDSEYSFNPPREQDWTFHITAAVIGVVTAWQAREEARKYRQLNSENEILLQKLNDINSVEDYMDLRESYYINQEKMKTHKRNYQLLDLLTVSALIWEAYLILFETHDEGIYDSTQAETEPDRFVVMPRVGNNETGVLLRWRW